MMRPFRYEDVMSKLFAIAFVLVSFTSFARAEDAATTFPVWNDVLRTCSAEYKERADKTKGREVWTSFLTECKARKGFVAKKDQGRADFVRVPDKTN